MKRFFSPRQRKALYHLANGRCQNCDKVLLEDWHADHIIPHSKGGKTTISNGQALCSNCNIIKSNKMIIKQFTPRKWQEDCRIEFFSSKKKMFSIGAVPGAGKSKAAAWIMSTLLDRGEIDLIIAVSPQGNKKQEWYEDFLQFFNIALDPNYSSTSIFKHRKFKGAILTYQGVNDKLAPDIQSLCKRYKVGVIADEPHHLSESDESAWGRYFKQAFAEAKYKVFLSGTYWREDKTPIPFIERDESGQYVIDYRYSYSDSLLDGNSRKMEFEFYDPEIVYEDISNGDYYEGKLSEVDSRLLDRCYRKLVVERNKDLVYVLQNALIKLHQIRHSDMPNAGMIVFAPDQETAKSLQSWLYTEDFGYTQSSVVISDDPESTNEIERFKRSSDMVLIAVNMVSEGIDIPRLRVGVYFSVQKTFLKFMQSIVGREIRVTQSEYLSYQAGEMKRVNFSHAFLLKHPKLFEFSKRVEDEMHEAEFREQDDDDGDIIGPEFSRGITNQISVDLSSLDVVNIGKKEFVTAGHHLEAEASEDLEQIFSNVPEGMSSKLESYLRMNVATVLSKQKVAIAEQRQQVVLNDPVLNEQRLSNQIKKYCNKIGGLLLQRTTASNKEVWQDIRRHLYERFGSLDIRKNDVSFARLEEAKQYAKDLFYQLEASQDKDVNTFNNMINLWRYEQNKPSRR